MYILNQEYALWSSIVASLAMHIIFQSVENEKDITSFIHSKLKKIPVRAYRSCCLNAFK